MTFSIVATDGQSWGVAVASKFLAVGASVPAAEAGVGAIATQAYANLAYRPDGLALLRSGRTAQETLDALTAADDQPAQRQAGIVDAAGRAATYTGDGCHTWAGGLAGDGFAVQGNILTGPEVVAAMQQAWLAAPAGQQPLAHRLLAALRAGDEAGGDRRGRQSAAIYVVRKGGGYGGGSDQLVDLRVDDHPSPVTELLRLLERHDVMFGPRNPEAALPLEGPLADEVRSRLSRLGHPPGDRSPDALDTALADWAGIENLEERLYAGRIDPIVLDLLRSNSGPSVPSAHSGPAGAGPGIAPVAGRRP